MKKKKSGRKHKTNYILVYIMIAVMAVIVLCVLSLTVFFPIEQVVVQGSSIYTAEQIEDSAHITMGKNLFTADMSSVQDSITSELPYIESVQIKRAFPSTIELTVTAAQVYVQLEYGEQYIKLNRAGKCLEVSDKPQRDVTLVRGAQPENPTPGHMLTYKDGKQSTELIELLTAGFEANELSDITVINIANEQDISATYANKIVLLFGSSANIDIKIAHAKTIVGMREQNNETGTLNLSRLPNEKDQASFIPSELTPEQTA